MERLNGTRIMRSRTLQVIISDFVDYLNKLLLINIEMLYRTVKF
jgi:hypothetical protein